MKDNWVLKSRIYDEEHMYTFLNTVAQARGLRQTQAALKFVKEVHDGQVRNTDAGEVPYINHLLNLATQAISMGLYEDELIATLLLHDVIEYTDTEIDDIPADNIVKEAVSLVSFDAKGRPYFEAKKDYYDKISSNPLACLVRCMDREHNLSTMAMSFNKTRMIEYIDETEKYILPLLNVCKNSMPAWKNAVWLIKYQTVSLIETYKRLI